MMIYSKNQTEADRRFGRREEDTVKEADGNGNILAQY